MDKKEGKPIVTEDREPLLIAALAARVHNGVVPYNEAEAEIVRTKANRESVTLEQAQEEAARELRAALAYLDEQKAARPHERLTAEGARKQAAYAAMRQAHSEAWFKTEPVQPEEREAVEPARTAKVPSFVP